jgi:16S rRNA (guanine(966)-N(2))-methyltransferase RsmD
VADLFAGTGSLGIEALSRGAGRADFVEADRKQVDVIRDNLKITKLGERANVIHATVERAVEGLRGPYDFVLMDPPYTKPFPKGVVARIGELGLLGDDGMAIVGHASRVAAPERCGTMVRWQDRRYGDASLAFYGAEQRQRGDGS